jgi:glutamine amidotransferase
MCEIFALCSLHPSRVDVCLHEIARHGAAQGPHADGWGLALFDRGDARVLREPRAASGSPWMRLAEREAPESPLVIGHLRHATQGEVRLANTQPFVRELGGRMHAFAHNGDLRGELTLGRFRPVGETDSERAFCHLLQELESPWLAGGAVPALGLRLRLLRRFADRIAALGPANFVYCDGETLFAHGDVRRNPGETEIRAPGLHAVWRNFVVEDGRAVPRGLRLAPGGRAERSVLLASVPLTAENWIPLPRGRLLALEAGRLLASA